MPNQSTAPQMRTLDEVAGLLRVSRGTVINRTKEWEDAAANGEAPPPGALRSVRWCGKRLIADAWLREALGLDVVPEPPPPVKKCRPRGRAFQRRVAEVRK
jgi:hypothetical protein